MTTDQLITAQKNLLAGLKEDAERKRAEYEAAVSKFNKFAAALDEETLPAPAPKAAAPVKAAPKPAPAKKAAPAKKPAPKAAPAKAPAPKAAPVKAAPAAKAAPKAAPAKKAAKAPAKAAPKPAAKAPAKGKDNAAAAKGRAEVKAGLRPTIKEAMTQVMADKTMNAAEIYDLLKAKNWLPSANDPRGYIAYLLSSMKDRFERVPDKGRGYYRVLKGAAPAVAAAKPNGKKAAPAAKGKKSTDKILEEAGVNSGEAFG